MEPYCCSKRYVDLRNLAIALRTNALATVKYYEKKLASPSSEGGGSDGGVSGSESSEDRGRRRTVASRNLFKNVERAFTKPIEVAQHIVNMEPSSSHLVNDLDLVFTKKTSNGRAGEEGERTLRRTSDFLHRGAPMFVREIMEGVDEFYDVIFSEKRQFGKKVSF